MNRDLFDVATEHYMAKNYQKAFDIWSQLTDNPTALYNAGIIVLRKEIVIPKSVSIAYGLFKKAAEMGHVGSKYYCGYLLVKYYGKEFLPTAVDYYMYALEGGEQRAFDAIKSMAEQGVPYSQAALSHCYLNGLGTEENGKEAEQWAVRAFREGEMRISGHVLGNIFENQKNYQKALYYFKEAANAGNHVLFGVIGDFYRKGLGTKINYSEALNWYTKGETAGHEDARYYLGYMRLKGMGCKKNKKDAIMFFERVVEGNEADPICWVGDLYFLGDQGLKNRSYGLKLLEKAATMGSSEANARLGSSYYLGWHVVQNYNRAFEYLSKAPDNYLAQEYLGLCHYYGRGCKKDEEKAKRYFKLAIENGNENARQYLDSQYELTPVSKWKIKKEGAGILGGFIAAFFSTILSSIGHED